MTETLLFDPRMTSDGLIKTRNLYCTLSYVKEGNFFQSCDTQCSEDDCDVIMIKNLLFPIKMSNTSYVCI